METGNQQQRLRGRDHSLHFRFASGLTLEADVICGEDNKAPWRLFGDDRRLHHWRQNEERAGRQ